MKQRTYDGCDDCEAGEPHACPDLHRDYLDLLAVRGHVEQQLDSIEAVEDDELRGIGPRLRGSAHRAR